MSSVQIVLPYGVDLETRSLSFRVDGNETNPIHLIEFSNPDISSDHIDWQIGVNRPGKRSGTENIQGTFPQNIITDNSTESRILSIESEPDVNSFVVNALIKHAVEKSEVNNRLTESAKKEQFTSRILATGFGFTSSLGIIYYNLFQDHHDELLSLGTAITLGLGSFALGFNLAKHEDLHKAKSAKKVSRELVSLASDITKNGIQIIPTTTD